MLELTPVLPKHAELVRVPADESVANLVEMARRQAEQLVALGGSR